MNTDAAFHSSIVAPKPIPMNKINLKDNGALGGLHPFVKLLLLGATMLLSALVVSLLGFVLAIPIFGTDVFTGYLEGDLSLNMIRYFQIISHLGLFIGASLVFAYLVGRDPLHYLHGKRIPYGRIILLSALIMLVAVPLVYFLVHLNQQMSLPESMSGLEEWMRQAEDAAEKMTERLLNVTSLQGLLFNLFMIAVIPAIGEEFIFRGALQRIFHQWTGNAHVAVIIAGVIFSAIHFQFYGFLPRLLLGIMLGYMFVITGNIWVPVFAHFFNNAFAVTMHFYVYNADLDFDMESVGDHSLSVIPAAISLVIVYILFRMMQFRSSKRME